MKLFPDESLASAALARGVPAFLLVNPIEYHGPHLSLRNDHLVSVGIARDLHAYLRDRSGEPADDFPLLVTRDLDVGVEPTAGPGSVFVSYAEVKRTVIEACRELRRLGAQKVVLVTFHGSPIHAFALEAGVSWLRRHGIVAFSPMNLLLNELIEADGARYGEAYAHVRDDAKRNAMQAGVASDFHGGFFETSLALHYAKSSVRAFYTRVPDCPPFGESKLLDTLLALVSRAGFAARAREISLVFRGASWMALRPFPGYTGAPSLASEAAGAAFAKLLLELYGPAAEDVLSGGAESPAPPLGWVRFVTLYGRVGVPTPASAMMKFPHLVGSDGSTMNGAAHATTTA